MLVWLFSGSALLLPPPPSSPCPGYPFPKEEGIVPPCFFWEHFCPWPWQVETPTCSQKLGHPGFTPPPTPCHLPFFFVPHCCLGKGTVHLYYLVRMQGRGLSGQGNCPRSRSCRGGDTLFMAISATPPGLSHISALSKSLSSWLAVRFFGGRKGDRGAGEAVAVVLRGRARSAGWTPV